MFDEIAYKLPTPEFKTTEELVDLEEKTKEKKESGCKCQFVIFIRIKYFTVMYNNSILISIIIN